MSAGSPGALARIDALPAAPPGRRAADRGRLQVRRRRRRQPGRPDHLLRVRLAVPPAAAGLDDPRLRARRRPRPAAAGPRLRPGAAARWSATTCSAPTASAAARPGSSIGLAGALYGAMGVGQAVQNACNTAWTVPRNERPQPVQVPAVAASCCSASSAVDVLGTTVAGRRRRRGHASSGPLVERRAAGRHPGHPRARRSRFVFRFATTRDLSWREVAARRLPWPRVAWLALQYVGVAYVGRTTDTSSATNGVFAVVLGLLAFLYLTSVVLVLCLELNVVLVDRPAPPHPADAVHRQRRADRRRQALLHRPGQGPAAQGLPDRRGRLRPQPRRDRGGDRGGGRGGRRQQGHDRPDRPRPRPSRRYCRLRPPT